jgi:hypothetical protein
MRICSVAPCGKSHKAKGWCAMHYRRWRLYGDPLLAQRPSWHWESFEADALARCRPDAATGCMIWTGGTDKDGYPKMFIDGKHWRGNRAMLLATTGRLAPEGMHSCDRPSCMAPEHLSWGTPRDNSADAFQKGRRRGQFRPQYGSRNGRSKLSDWQRNEIVRRTLAGVSPAILASDYGVHIGTVRRVRKQRGVAWAPGRPARPGARSAA